MEQIDCVVCHAPGKSLIENFVAIAACVLVYIIIDFIDSGVYKIYDIISMVLATDSNSKHVIVALLPQSALFVIYEHLHSEQAFKALIK